MTYGVTLESAPQQKGQNALSFPLPPKTDWAMEGKGASIRVRTGASEPHFPVLRSTVTTPVFRGIAGVWEEAGPSIVQTLELQLSQVKQLYTFRSEAEVIAFLQRFSFLIALLLELYGKIAEYFGLWPEVVLEVVTEPEAEGQSELFALIRTNLSPSEALACLERFDQEWWLDASERAQCMLNVDVEYV